MGWLDDPFGQLGLGKQVKGARDILFGESENPYADKMAQVAQQIYGETADVRGGFLEQYEGLLSGEFDPQTSPMFAPAFAMGKEGIEGQYGVAKENILANMPRGGAQLGQLGGLEMARAGQSASLPAMISQNIMGDMMGQAYGAAFGAPGQAMQGFGQAANIYGQQQAAQSNLMADLGLAIGLGLG